MKYLVPGKTPFNSIRVESVAPCKDIEKCLRNNEFASHLHLNLILHFVFAFDEIEKEHENAAAALSLIEIRRRP